MPRRAKKLNVKSEQNTNRLSTRSDFTVYDYAHSGKIISANIPQYKTRSSASSGRLQKAATNAWQTEVKQLRGQSVLLQPQLTLSATHNDEDQDDDVDDGEHDETLTDGDLVRVKPASQQQRGRKQSSRRVGSGGGGGGLVYPVDLWFLVGDYVAPEDVCTFACICHDTHVVAHSARFWLNIYRRFCRGCNSLPMSLQSTSVEHRPHGLRTRVIRALFRVYRPLSERLVNQPSSTVSCHADPHRLTGLRCLTVWQERSSNRTGSSTSSSVVVPVDSPVHSLWVHRTVVLGLSAVCWHRPTCYTIQTSDVFYLWSPLHTSCLCRSSWVKCSSRLR